MALVTLRRWVVGQALRLAGGGWRKPGQGNHRLAPGGIARSRKPYPHDTGPISAGESERWSNALMRSIENPRISFGGLSPLEGTELHAPARAHGIQGQGSSGEAGSPPADTQDGGGR